MLQLCLPDPGLDHHLYYLPGLHQFDQPAADFHCRPLHQCHRALLALVSWEEDL